MGHLTGFAVELHVIIERVISFFGPPETLHSEQGTELKNRVMYLLQQILGYKKTRTTPYRPQENSVSERILSTMHSMLAMRSAIDQSNWASLFPLGQLAHITCLV